MANDTKFRNRNFKSVGTRPPRPDGLDKVTGRAKYGADTFAPGQLVGLVLRSPHAHAEIKTIDIAKAEKLSGVKAVITSSDLPDLTNGDRDLYDTLENCMARDRALYDGHAVAAVAAIDMPTAKKALKLIKITYKILPHVTDVDEAVKPGAYLGDIGHAIQKHAEKNRFSVVRDFTGHGLGTEFHTAPTILHYGEKDTGVLLKEGMFFTIEPMINAGGHAVKVLSDGWTARTKDYSLSAQFEHSVGVTSKGHEIFTLSKKNYTQPPYY